jgi:uroporphyrinogen-III decarboxylase
MNQPDHQQRIEAILKGVITLVAETAMKKNGMTLSKEDKRIAATIRPLTMKQATAAITTMLNEQSQAADKTLDEVLTERDALETKLDSLSEAVAAYFKQDIGEHSSANDPWYNAYEMLRDNTAHLTGQQAYNSQPSAGNDPWSDKDKQGGDV